MPQPADSPVQREAETTIIGLASKLLHVELSERTVRLPGGSLVEIDGATKDLSVLVQAFARQGPMKGGQKRKVALDVLKLITVRKHHPDANVCLAFCDESARESITGWAAEAIDIWDVKTFVVPLDEDLRNRLLRSQAMKFR